VTCLALNYKVSDFKRFCRQRGQRFTWFNMIPAAVLCRVTNLGAMQERHPGNNERCKFVPNRRAHLALLAEPFLFIIGWLPFFSNRNDLNLYLVGSASALLAPASSLLTLLASASLTPLASASSIRALETSNSSRFSRRSAKLQYHRHLKSQLASCPNCSLFMRFPNTAGGRNVRR